MPISAGRYGSGEIEVWSDTEVQDLVNGRCIGHGRTLDEAKATARQALADDLAALDRLTEADVKDYSVPEADS